MFINKDKLEEFKLADIWDKEIIQIFNHYDKLEYEYSEEKFNSSLDGPDEFVPAFSYYRNDKHVFNFNIKFDKIKDLLMLTAYSLFEDDNGGVFKASQLNGKEYRIEYRFSFIPKGMTGETFRDFISDKFFKPINTLEEPVVSEEE